MSYTAIQASPFELPADSVDGKQRKLFAFEVCHIMSSAIHEYLKRNSRVIHVKFAWSSSLRPFVIEITCLSIPHVNPGHG